MLSFRDMGGENKSQRDDYPEEKEGYPCGWAISLMHSL
jgi:hypothetical protein